jgi:hypothetical protein
MSVRTSSAKRKAISASAVLETIAKSLSNIKSEDRLTYVDIGRIVGRGDDMAARYCDGTADMPMTAFAFAWKEWNGRFIGDLASLIEEARGDTTSDREKESSVLKAALALSLALADDDLTDGEIRANRTTLENAKDAIDVLLGRIKPRAVER